MNLKEKLLRAIARQNEIIQNAREGQRDLTENEQREFDTLQAQIDALRAEINNTDHDAEIEAERQRAAEAERSRVTEISNLCREFEMDATDMISDSDMTIDRVRETILNHIRQNGAPAAVRVTTDEGDKFRDAASDALIMRSGLTVATPAEGASELRSMSLRDLSIEALSREGGESVTSLMKKSPTDIYNDLCRTFYNPTAAFPAILDSAIKKSIVEIYNKVPTTFEAFTTEGTLSDFKETPEHYYVMGGVGDLLEVPENGELKADKPSTQLLPTKQLKTFGRQFSMSRQAFINDDIGFITKMPGAYATAMKKTINKQVYTLLYGNKVIYDGKTLFHSDHKNLIETGSAPSAASLQAAILKMQLQKDQFDEPIYMTPGAVIVPVGYGFALQTIFASAQIPGSSNNDANPLYKYPLGIVEEPLLNALAKTNACPWFLSADKSSSMGIEIDYLNGQKVPNIVRGQNPGQLGFVWDIYGDWAVALIDYRGFIKNPGVTL